MANINYPSEATIDSSNDTVVTPETGQVCIYFDSFDDNLKVKNSTGEITTVGSSGINFVDQIIPANSSQTFNQVDTNKYINCTVELDIPGPKLTVTPFDEDNIGTLEAGWANGNFTDTIYNNSTAGQYPLNFYGVDLGSSQEVSYIRIHHWTNAAYTPSNWEIQTGTTLANLTSVITGLDSTGREGEFEDFLINSNVRYIRPRIITSNNASFCVISECEVFGQSTESKIVQVSEIEAVVQDDAGKIRISNNELVDLTFRIHYGN